MTSTPSPPPAETVRAVAKQNRRAALTDALSGEQRLVEIRRVVFSVGEQHPASFGGCHREDDKLIVSLVSGVDDFVEAVRDFVGEPAPVVVWRAVGTSWATLDAARDTLSNASDLLSATVKVPIYGVSADEALNMVVIYSELPGTALELKARELVDVPVIVKQGEQAYLI